MDEVLVYNLSTRQLSYRCTNANAATAGACSVQYLRSSSLPSDRVQHAVASLSYDFKVTVFRPAVLCGCPHNALS
jgi:hypothetical protein